MSIIDFTDDFDVQAEIETLYRMRQYAERGYTIEAETKWLERLSQSDFAWAQSDCRA